MKKRKKRKPLVQLVLPTAPTTPERNQSDVARLMAEITAHYESAQWALSGHTVGVSQHAFITRRMEHIGILHEELEKHLTPEEAAKAMIEAMEKPDEAKESEDT